MAAVLALPAVGLSALVYLPIVTTYFYADDFVHMLGIADRGFLHFVFSLFGGHILVLRNLVFYLSYRLFGFTPAPYYWTVLLTHLLNVWLLFRVVRRLTASALVAAFGAMVWGTCPLCASTLGWYSVYGQVLVVTILLVLLEQIARRAEDAAPPPVRTVMAWGLLSLAAVTCFGIGVGIGIVLPAVVLLLVPETLQRRGSLLACLGLPLATIGFYFGYRCLWATIVPLPLSEVVVVNLALRHYLPVLEMVWHLVAVGITGLLRGVYFVPATYPDAASHVTVALFGAGALAVLIGADGTVRCRLLAMLALCLGVYGIIAVGRANFYTTTHVAPDASARQLRYQYAGILPLAVVLCLIVAHFARRLRAPVLLPGAVLATWLAAWAYGFARGGVWIDQHTEARRSVASAAHAIDAMIDGVPVGQTVEVPNRALPPAMLGLLAGPTVFPGWAGVFVLLHPENAIRGRPVRFVERDPAVLAVAARGRRLAGLLVPPAADGR